MPATCATTEVDALAGRTDAIVDMMRGGCDSLVIKRVFDPDQLAEVVKRLDHAERFFPASALKTLRFRNGGELVDAEPLLIRTIGDPISNEGERYLSTAEHLHWGTRALFAGGVDFEHRIESVLSQLTGGRQLVRARAHDGRSYSGWTFRVLPPDVAIDLHVGHSFFDWERYREMAGGFDYRTQVSFFVLLQKPERGGVLEILDVTHDDARAQAWHRRTLPGYVAHQRDIIDYDSIDHDFEVTGVPMEAGDMLLFHGGEFYHRVSMVHGARPRITVGGFLGLSSDDQRLMYWA